MHKWHFTSISSTCIKQFGENAANIACKCQFYSYGSNKVIVYIVIEYCASTASLTKFVAQIWIAFTQNYYKKINLKNPGDKFVKSLTTRINKNYSR